MTQTNPTSSLGPYTEDRDLGGDIGEGPVTNDFAAAPYLEHTQQRASSKLNTSPVAASTCARTAADLSHLTLSVHNLS